MKPSRIINLLGPWGWAVAAVGLALTVWLIVWLIGSPGREAQARFDGRVAEEKGAAAHDTAKGAIVVAGDTAKANAETQDARRENEADIRSAEGAGDAVNAGAAAAGRRGLCKYEAYRHRPECVQRPRP